MTDSLPVTLFAGSQFGTGKEVNIKPKGAITVTVTASDGVLAVPVYIEAATHLGNRVAKIIREPGSYLVPRTGRLRASLSGDNPSRVTVTAEY